MQRKSIVISLGGSIIVPNKINVNFLKKFKKMILRNLTNFERIFIITGGGALAREYQHIAIQINKEICKEDMDWLGIHATRINAHLMRTIFREYAYPKVIKRPLRTYNIDKPIVIACGWKPGWSTDYISVLIAKKYGIKTIYNLSNISYVYDKDPRYNDDAKKLSYIAWRDFRKMVGDKWEPGLSLPFDPIASRLAQRENMIVYVLNGKNLANVEKCLNGKTFIGTEIS